MITGTSHLLSFLTMNSNKSAVTTFQLPLLYVMLMFSCILVTASVEVRISTEDMLLSLKSSSEFSLILSEVINMTVFINFTYNANAIDPLPSNCSFKENSNESLNYIVNPQTAGHVTVLAHAMPGYIDTSNAFVRISIYKIQVLNVISDIIGWCYFIAWSISFYPQMYSNWKRKSVVGMNFDYVILNVTGFISYSIFNCGLLFIRTIQREYHSIYPTGLIPVQINDAVFALHAVFAMLIICVQCLIYERGGQRISRVAQGISLAIWLSAAVMLFVVVLGGIKSQPYLTYMYFFSYVKLGVTLIKYMPQVYFNYRRKSTSGWNIGNILLDFTGGTLSILQMFIMAYNYNDWSSIFGNFTKFGLGFISILFDILFMVQHYCLYRPGKALSESGSSSNTEDMFDSSEADHLINATSTSQQSKDYGSMGS